MPEIDSAEALENVFQEWLDGPLPSETAQHGFELDLANRRVAYRYRDPELTRVFGRALRHRAVKPSTAPDSTIHIFIGDTSGLTLPRLRLKPIVMRQKRKVQDWSDQSRSVFFFPVERGVAVYNHHTCNACIWFPSIGTIPVWEHASPLQWFHDLVTTQFGQATVHAAAVGRNGKGVLIAGPSGAGKSTLSLACLGAGLDFASDDYCVAELGSKPVCHSLYSTAKWKTNAQVLPEWLLSAPEEMVEQADTKRILYVEEFLPSRIALKLDLRAIIVPLRTDDTVPRLVPCRSEAAFRALAPSTVFQSEADSRDIIPIVSELTRQLPAYQFHTPASADSCGTYLADNLDSIL